MHDVLPEILLTLLLVDVGGKMKDEGRRMFKEGREKLRDEVGNSWRGGSRAMSKLTQPQLQGTRHEAPAGHPSAAMHGGLHCQIMRSCDKWSHGVEVEVSCCKSVELANAHISNSTQ